MKIEAGKYYVTRGGDVVGPIEETGYVDWVWRCPCKYGTEFYLGNGQFYRGGSDHRDLIKEHVMPKFRVGDRVKSGAWEGTVTYVKEYVEFVASNGLIVRRNSDLVELISSPPPSPSLDLTKPVQTRDGRKVRVLCTDGPGELPVVGFIEDNVTTTQWPVGGEYYGGALRNFDLVNTPAAPRTFERWFNVYKSGSSFDHATREDADNMTYPDRIARKRVVFTEGEWDE